MVDAATSACDEIAGLRRFGRTTCTVAEIRTLSDQRKGVARTLDQFVQKLGFVPLESAWVEISRHDAARILCEILARDLAYHTTIMTDETAYGLAERFLSLFGEDVRCFTNGNLVLPGADPSEVPGAWTAMSRGTFDSGIVCIDGKSIGILWVEDED